MSCPADRKLLAMLAATNCGILTGDRGCTAIAQWVRNQKTEFWHLLGFRRNPPTTNYYRDLLLAIPAETLENVYSGLGGLFPEKTHRKRFMDWLSMARRFVVGCSRMVGTSICSHC